MADARSQELPDREKCLDLVLEGGGMKGLALIGAMSVLEEHGFCFQNVAGTSAGAIVATLLAAGYKAAELRTILETMDFKQFMDKSKGVWVPGIGKPWSIFKEDGLYQGEAFLAWMRERLLAKGIKTFGDLAHPKGWRAGDPRYRYRVQVIASDLTQRRLLLLPLDATTLGIEPDDLEVAVAVRMSMSLPLYFEPVRFHNLKTGVDHVIVDGGLLSNYPVWLFDRHEGIPHWATFGLKLVVTDQPRALGTQLSQEPHHAHVPELVNFLHSILETMLEAHDRMYIEKADFARTIAIPTMGVRTTDFQLGKERARALFNGGRTAAEEFLAKWDFDQYIAKFRSDPTSGSS